MSVGERASECTWHREGERGKGLVVEQSRFVLPGLYDLGLAASAAVAANALV